MNTVERRRMIKDRLVDTLVAKADVNASRRQQREAARQLRKSMMASHFAASRTDTLSLPQR